MKRLLLVALLAGAGYLLAWPVDISPTAWTAPVSAGFTGPYAANQLLAGTRRLPIGPHGAPEDIAFGPDGKLYGGGRDGTIVRMDPDGSHAEPFASTGGTPLGLRFDASGRLIVADAIKGLLAVYPGGQVETLVNAVDGKHINLADDLDIAADGKIYFSDASSRFPFSNYQRDFLEHGPNGSLLVYDPQTRATKVLLKDMYFANGIAVSPDQTFVLVVESSAYRITRYWLAGPRAGGLDIFVDNLPGVPDGVLSNGRDTFWVSIPAPRIADLDNLLPHPFLRNIVARLPQALSPKPVKYGCVLGFGLDGKLRHNLQDPGGNAYSAITNIVEHEGKLYFGSLTEPAIGVLALPAASAIPN